MKLTPENFPRPGTEAWQDMNERRYSLIDKKFDNGLDLDEELEFERLQELSSDASLETPVESSGGRPESITAVASGLEESPGFPKPGTAEWTTKWDRALVLTGKMFLEGLKLLEAAEYMYLKWFLAECEPNSARPPAGKLWHQSDL